MATVLHASLPHTYDNTSADPIDGENNLNFTSAEIVARGDNYIDVSFSATQGEFHWVIFDDLPGAYQYFVNRALPTLGVFRSLFRLDNETFPRGRTNIKDDILPPFSLYVGAPEVQDETFQLPNGTYLTKYDWSAFIRDIDFYGVYGDNFGSWYIRPGEDYFNGNHLKQELIVCALLPLRPKIRNREEKGGARAPG